MEVFAQTKVETLWHTLVKLYSNTKSCSNGDPHSLNYRNASSQSLFFDYYLIPAVSKHLNCTSILFSARVSTVVPKNAFQNSDSDLIIQIAESYLWVQETTEAQTAKWGAAERRAAAADWPTSYWPARWPRRRRPPAVWSRCCNKEKRQVWANHSNCGERGLALNVSVVQIESHLRERRNSILTFWARAPRRKHANHAAGRPHQRNSSR